MAKSFRDVFFDENPKTIAKIEKALEKKQTLGLLENLKRDLVSETCVDYTKLRVFVSNNYVCQYNLGIKYDIDIIPLANVSKVYRSSLIGDNFDYDNFHLCIETTDGIPHLFARMPHGKIAKFKAYDEVIADIRGRLASQGGM